MRNFDTGATRDVDTNKLDFEGFLSPAVLERYAEYMHKNRVQADGNLRDSDNWQKGIPKEAYMKSMWRHFLDVWKAHRGLPTKDSLEDALAALMFNVMGYLYETIRDRDTQYAAFEEDLKNGRWDNRKLGAEEAFAKAISEAQPREYVREDSIYSLRFYDEQVDNREENLHNAMAGHFTNAARDTNMGAFTHRYGALAHDQEAIDAEDNEGPGAEDGPWAEGWETRSVGSGAFYIRDNGEWVQISDPKNSENQTYIEKRYTSPLPPQGYSHEASDNPAFPGVSGVEHSEVLGICPQRTQSEVDAMASEVRNNGGRKA